MKFIRNIVSAGMMVSLVLVLVFTVIDVAVLQDRAFLRRSTKKIKSPRWYKFLRRI